MSNTKVTATPRPRAVFTVFDTARYEHMPRKNAKIILSTKIERTNRLIKCSIIYCKSLLYALCAQMTQPTRMSDIAGMVIIPLFT